MGGPGLLRSYLTSLGQKWGSRNRDWKFLIEHPDSKRLFSNYEYYYPKGKKEIPRSNENKKSECKDEWEKFLEQIGRSEFIIKSPQDSPSDTLEQQFWASYRGQTLARIVRSRACK